VFERLLSKKFWRRVIERSDEDEILGRAAQLSYYFLLAIFPLLIFIITLFCYLNGGTDLQLKLISYLGDVMPPAASHLVVSTLDEVIKGRGTLKLSFGLAFALLAASSGVNALARALNAAYDVRETRPWWKVRLISIALTLALSLLIISALLIVLYGGQFGQTLAALIHEGRAFAAVWRILQWPIALTFVFLAFDMIYRFVPNVAAKRKGKGLPETKINKFPTVETYREQIDGKYWFPTYSYADEELIFDNGEALHIRMKVRYTDFAPARADVKVIEVDGSELPNQQVKPPPAKPKP